MAESPFLLWEVLKHKGKLFGGAGFLQDTAHHDAQTDDDTGALERVAETVLDRSDQTGDGRAVIQSDIADWHAADEAGDSRRDQKSHKGVDFGLHDQEDHDRNTDCKAEYHSCSFTHDSFPLSCEATVIRIHVSRFDLQWYEQ